MRIVELVPSLDVGGAERMAGLLSLALAARGHEVTVVSLYDPVGSPIEQELRAAGVPLRFLGKKSGLDPRMLLRLRGALQDLRPDVVHTHLHTLKYLLPLKRGFAAAHTLHNLAQHEVEPASQRVHGLAFRLGVAPVAIGDAVAISVREVYGREAAAVIPNGIPVASMQATPGARAAVRAELGLPADAPVLLTVGRLTPQKNQAMLLRAMAHPGLAGATLLVAGDGELRAALETQAAPLGERVRFLGIRRDVPALLAACDVFTLASDWEGNPLVVMEAMAAGRAVVATSVGCVPELVPAHAGRLVAPGSDAALAEALAAVLADRAACEALGNAAAHEARQRFDVSGMAAAYEALFARLNR